MATEKKLCVGVDKPCVRPVSRKGEKYCESCRGIMLRKMKDSGYLVRLPSDDYTAPADDSETPESRKRLSHDGPWDGNGQ